MQGNTALYYSVGFWRWCTTSGFIDIMVVFPIICF